MILGIAAFTIVEGKEKAVADAAGELVEKVLASEKGTWLYKVFVHRDTESQPVIDYLVFTEGYVSDDAFQKHIADGSLFREFAAAAVENHWLEPGNAFGLKSDFASLDLQGQQASGTCSVNTG